MGYALDAIRKSLADPGDGVFRDTAWLEPSWRQPEAFAAALMQHHAALDPAPLKSDPKNGYDLYYDLVLRNALADRTALWWLGSDHLPQRLSYAQIHAQCTEQRAKWLARGVTTGQRLCVVAELGPELCIPLLTGLRLGLEVSLLPSGGPDFLTRRLRALDPSWVALAPRYLPLLRGSAWEHKVLIDPPSTLPVDVSTDASSHTYAGQAVALRIFSPTQLVPEQPAEVTAAAAYHGALRDGLLLLGLHPSQVVAVAEQNLLQVQPALLLSTMLRGAALLVLQARDFARDERHNSPLASLPPINVLFVNAALRAVMLEAPQQPIFSALKLWVKSPQEDPAVNQWNDWVQRWGLQSTPAMTLLLDASCGGSVLFSRRRFGTPAGYLMPAPGLPFALLQPDHSGAPARADYGKFQPTAGSISLLLTRIDGGYLYAGTVTPTQDGRCYPKTEVEEAVADLSFVRGASVVQEPGDRGRSTLLIFTGPETVGYARRHIELRKALLRQAITTRLTPDYLPAQTVVNAQLPRFLSGGGIDHLWCAQTFLSGELRRRASNPVFALLDRLLLAVLPALKKRSV